MVGVPAVPPLPEIGPALAPPKPVVPPAAAVSCPPEPGASPAVLAPPAATEPPIGAGVPGVTVAPPAAELAVPPVLLASGGQGLFVGCVGMRTGGWLPSPSLSGGVAGVTGTSPGSSG